MATETNLHTTPTLSPDIPALWMRDELLERSERNLVFWDIATKVAMPKGEGKTVQFTRYERLPLPSRPAEESVTPTMTPISLSTVQATVDQWIAGVSMSDVVQLTIRHPLVQQARDLLSDQHDETVDREVQVVTMGSSAVYFAGNKASRALLTSVDTLKSDDVRRLVSTLRSLGARPMSGGDYTGIFDPFVEADTSKDATFVQAGTYSQVETLRAFEIGRWLGVRWRRSNFIPILSQMAAADVTYVDLTGGGIPAGATAFTAGSTVRTKVTRLNSQTRFEEVIDNSEANTNVAAFATELTIAAAAVTGTYRIYSALEAGAAGTETLQGTVEHTVGTANVIVLVKGGTATGNTWVVTPTGPVAPPDCPAAINIHLSYVFGKGALGATTLDSLQTFVTAAGANQADPAAQRRYVTWKQMFKAIILNPDYFRRVESASDFS